MLRPFTNIFLRRLALGLWCLLPFGLAAALLFPIRFGSLRLFLIVGWVLLWVGAVCLFWSRRPALIVLGAIALIAACFAGGPGRALNTTVLRYDYLAALRSYQGAPYLWGGECRRGIDCSGLVRRAMMDATLRQGITRLNPAATRAALELWFFDSSAEAMGNEYRNRTRQLFPVRSLNHLANSSDAAQMQPGDFAVTANGVHTLAYLGNGEWIQADPGAGKVTVNRVPSKDSWFTQPMKIMRWRLLEQ